MPDDTQSSKQERRMRKRQKRQHFRQISQEKKVNRLEPERLPFELLAEICMFTGSPAWALSLARTCSYLCKVLVSPNAAFIWRSLRKEYVAGDEPLAIPDPIPIFTEPAYAAFVFDGGVCDNCGASTDKSYSSYSLRIRLCARPECPSQYYRKHLTRLPGPPQRLEKQIVTWIPKLDTDNYLRHPPAVSNTISGLYPTVRVSEYDQALAEYLEITQGPAPKSEPLNEYIDRRKIDAQRMKLWMTMCSQLISWKGKVALEDRRVKDHNRTYAKRIAKAMGWSFPQLSDCQSWLSLYIPKTRSLEFISDQDWRIIAPNVEKEQLKAKHRRIHRNIEVTKKHNSEVINQYYDHLRNNLSFLPMPTLPTFRTLAIIVQLTAADKSESKQHESAPAALDFGSLVKNDIIRDVVRKQVIQLRNKARDEFAKMIGKEGWETASSKMVHPVEQVHQRFICTRCQMVAPKLWADECLTFFTAFSHSCPRKIQGIVKKQLEWKASRFMVDEKAERAITKVVKLYGRHLEMTQSLTDPEVDAWDPTSHLICNSCPGVIVLHPSDVVGHSHRHDEMEMELVKLPTAMVKAIPPRQSGVARKFQCPSDPDIVKLVNERNYGCRHCLQQRPMIGNGGTGIILPPEMDKFQKSAMSWNGLRSHLKAKHLIEKVRDEDAYSFKPIDFSGAPVQTQEDDFIDTETTEGGAQG